jgi:hypothetical protein
MSGALTRPKRQATLTVMAQDAVAPRKVLYRVMFGRRDPLKVLADISTLRAYLDEREVEVVKSARERQQSWAAIGANTGMSRQAAWERWQELDPAPNGDAP